MRRAIAVVLSVAAVTASGLSLSAPAGAAPSRGNFVSACGYSHTLPDDPIVFPRVRGASHSHDFVANISTNAFSTYQSLRAADTTCRREGDTAAYWVPSLRDGGRVVRPRGALAYYQTGGKPNRSIKPFPAGLKMIAGDAHATSPPSRRVISWGCGAASPIPDSPNPPQCPQGSMLRAKIRFPDCWDGQHRDSADHKSHMAYNVRGRCPSSHPTGVPKLLLILSYPTSGGNDVTLASGSPYTEHADFFNAWDQRVLTTLVARCLNLGVTCGQRG